MLTKAITYTDYNGTERTDNYYFNLTEAELLEMNLDSTNGLENEIKAIIDNNDTKASVNMIKKFMLKAYGVKSEDGRRFVKNKEVLDEFVQSEAFSKLFMELVTDEQKCTAFFTSIIPSTAASATTPKSV